MLVAQGLDLNVTLKYKEVSIPAGYVAQKIDVKGLLEGTPASRLSSSGAMPTKSWPVCC